MTSKKYEIANEFNDCTKKFSETDPCYLECKNKYKNNFENCKSNYGYGGEEYDKCLKINGDEYSNCIEKCPSSYDACKWVYDELNKLTSEIFKLCK